MTPTLVLALALSATPPALPTPAEAADGWIALFDGETTNGWSGATVKDGALTIPPGGSADYMLPIPNCQYRIRGVAGKLDLKIAADTMWLRALHEECNGVAKIVGDELWADAHGAGGHESLKKAKGAKGPIRLGFTNTSNALASVRAVQIRPETPTQLFNGRDLDGWKLYQGDAKREKSRFTVTDQGELRVQNGPGDLQTVGKYDNFLLQLKCKTNGDNLNSGVFFRCIDGQYQQGYEAQIHNGVKDGDITKPTDQGTGAIYRRQPARQVVSRDRESFTLTLLAYGPQFATWVDGVPVMNWTDERKPDDNARKGLRLAAGHLSIQGHDPTTDILFKDLRIVRLK